MTKLFIIGNGFDQDHKLKTSYNDFREYLLSQHPEINMEEFNAPTEHYDKDGERVYDRVEVLSMLFFLINEAENNTEWWSELESSLGHLDFSPAFDYNEDILDEDGHVHYFRTANRNEDIGSGLVIPTLTIQHLFADWINNIDLNAAKVKSDFQRLVSVQDCFLSFNYTDTLEEIYKIAEDNVCHIHGKQNEKIFFGHGNTEDQTDYYMQMYIGSEDSLNAINRQLLKNTDEAIENNLDFFDDLEKANIKEIYSYGFSFGKVDHIYLKEIFSRINTENVMFYLNDYDYYNHDEYQQILINCGYKGTFDTFHIAAD
ncbi:hypothetical protein FZD47_21140 [Bacillus infantis]|uniref:Bacteriophage abortive infection AbiH n=1 Tax=Bacillus infantis TaxID=324767 RepID=A0A5D4SG03_9BACI|nr:bacteriophage abortive infection AbiH family protein [Bacillus infantis]TYS60716.1 hypothetical protein FZD47_21140 [Bacillus infantis]